MKCVKLMIKQFGTRFAFSPMLPYGTHMVEEHGVGQVFISVVLEMYPSLPMRCARVLTNKKVITA
jgi:hypothetical protein